MNRDESCRAQSSVLPVQGLRVPLTRLGIVPIVIALLAAHAVADDAANRRHDDDSDSQQSSVTPASQSVAVVPKDSVPAGDSPDARLLVLVVGNGGTQAYRRQFAQWAARWKRAAEEGNVNVIEIGPAESPSVATAAPTDGSQVDLNSFVETAVYRAVSATLPTPPTPKSTTTATSKPTDSTPKNPHEAASRADGERANSSTHLAKGSRSEPSPFSNGRTDRQRLRRVLHTVASLSTPADESSAATSENPRRLVSQLWIVLIGHGTFDGRRAKFNLRGPDVTASDLSEWLPDDDIKTVIVNCASSSGPFLNRLSSADRVVVTATRSGFEHNFARFGDYLSQAVADPSADLDKDGQTSLLEAFLTASRQTEQFYENEGRLTTEHALLDDNGDRQGVPADWFRGVRPARQPATDVKRRPASDVEPDGYRAHQMHLVQNTSERHLTATQIEERNSLELRIFRLRRRKAEFPEDEYYRRLESLLLALARLYESSKL